jgi:hypothetical protein
MLSFLVSFAITYLLVRWCFRYAVKQFNLAAKEAQRRWRADFERLNRPEYHPGDFLTIQGMQNHWDGEEWKLPPAPHPRARRFRWN